MHAVTTCFGYMKVLTATPSPDRNYSVLMTGAMLLAESISCMTAELTEGMCIWEGVGGLWPCYLQTVTLCETFVSIQTRKRHLISPHGAPFAPVLEIAKSLSHLFISYNELHPGFLLNKPASEIALFISLVLRLCTSSMEVIFMSEKRQRGIHYFFCPCQ